MSDLPSTIEKTSHDQILDMQDESYQKRYRSDGGEYLDRAASEPLVKRLESEADLIPSLAYLLLMQGWGDEPSAAQSSHPQAYGLAR